MAFSTDTHFNAYLPGNNKISPLLGMYAKMVKWFECCAAEPDLGVRILAGMSNFLFTFILFSFSF